MLEAILGEKRREVATLRETATRAEFESQIQHLPPPRDFRSALRHSIDLAVIAEIKRKSPSKGVLRADLDPAKLAKEYATGGASAISVLTDQKFFGGSLNDLTAVRAAVALPILRKDFMIDELQVYQARAAGADAVLLIVAALTPDRLAALIQFTQLLSLSALVEVHAVDEAKLAIDAGATIIGINNRNLKTFEVDLSTTIRIAPLLPRDICIVAESGIRSVADTRYLKDCGADAVLVGEALVASDNPAQDIRKMRGTAS